MNKTTGSNPTLAKYRPYILGAVFGAMLLYFGGEWLVKNLLQGPIERAGQRTERLREEIKEREDGLARARKAAKQLAVWRTQSLPSNTEVARSLYQAWLVELVDYVKLGNPSVNSGEPVSRRGLYQTIGFSVRGRGTLQQLTELLFVFYRTDLLHQVRSLSIIPLANSDQLDLSISIETLVLPDVEPEAPKGATEEERQATIFEDFRQRAGRDSDRLASVALTDYAPIVRRNLFGIGGEPDPTDHTYLTAVSSVDGEPLAWFTVRTSGEILKLRKGGSFEIGQLNGTIAEIEGSDVIIEADGERWLLTLGESLTDASALPPEF